MCDIKQNKIIHKSVEAFALALCDIWGPYSTSTYLGARYFLTSIDNFTRRTWIYLLNKKAPLVMHLNPLFHGKTPFGKKIKQMRNARIG